MATLYRPIYLDPIGSDTDLKDGQADVSLIYDHPQLYYYSISSGFKQSVFLMFHHMDYLSRGFLPKLPSVSFSSGGRGSVVLLAFLHVVALAYRRVLH